MSLVPEALRAFRSDRGFKGQLLRGGVGSVAIKIGSTGLNFILAIMLARLLGAEGFGIYSFVFALVTILAIPAQSGLPTLVVRETAKARHHSNWQRIRALWQWAAKVSLSLGVIIAATVALIGTIWVGILPEYGREALFWATLLVPLIALGNIRGAALRGLKKVQLGQLPEFILRPSFFILGLLLASNVYSGLNAANAMQLHALAAGASFASGALLLYWSLPRELFKRPKSSLDRKALITAAFPLALIEGLNAINQNIGVIILGWWGNALDVATFKIAIQFSMLSAFAFTTLHTLVSPYLAEIAERGERERLQKLVSSVATLTFAFSLISFVVFIFLGSWVIDILLGSQYSSSYSIACVLLVGQLVNGATGCVGALLSMSGRERYVLKGMALSTAVSLTLHLLLIPAIGVYGAAVASASALCTWNIVLLYQASKFMSVLSVPAGSYFSRALGYSDGS